MILFAPRAGTITYSTRNPAVAGAGIVIQQGTHVVQLNIKDHGSLVTDAWFVIADAANRDCGAIIVELPDEVCKGNI